MSTEMENLNCGTLGHVDHGKTTLTTALSKLAGKVAVDFDSLDKAPEEKQRGITINTAHVEYFTAKRRYSHVDCPGHKDYIKNAITGAAQMDAAILVMSAEDGVMPQTKEHILLAQRQEIKHVILFVNKWDRVKGNEELEELAEMSIDEALDELEAKGYARGDVKIIRGSALKALEEDPEYVGCITELLNALDEVPTPQRATDKPLIMPIEGIESIEGRGTVITGRIEQGTLVPGDYELVGLQETRKVTVTSIETFRRKLESAPAGDNVGALLRGVKKDEVVKGQVLSAIGAITPHTIFQAEVYLSKKEEGGRHKPVLTGYKPQFYCKTANVTGKIILPEGKEMLMPGDTCELTIELEKAIAIDENTRFLMREGGLTIGPGKVTKIIK